MSTLPVLDTPLGPLPTASGAPAGTPLEVSLDAVTPSALPLEQPRSRRGGPRARDRQTVTVTGQVANRSDSTWTDLNVYLLTSSEPLTSAAALDEANRTGADVAVGGRLTGPGEFVRIPDLQPGASTDFRVDVPRSALSISGEPGVYWLGVHVLGANEDGRDTVADGRARTFLPLVDPQAPDTRLSLLLPVRAPVQREPDGRLEEAAAWEERLSDDGRLGRLMELSSTAGDFPLTWVVDPAVVDAARSVALGNPPVSTAPSLPDEDPESPAPTLPTEDPSMEPGGEGGEAGSEDGSTDGPPEELSAGAQVGQDWLAAFTQLAGRHEVLVLPYGDVDVAAMLRGDFAELYERATDLSAMSLAALGVEATPVLSPPSGYLPRAALEKVDPSVPVVLTDDAAPRSDRAVTRSRQGNQVVLTSSAVAAGGPLPAPRHSALALRQRILAEAAVHSLTGDPREPLVVAMPELWDPGSDWRSASFFAGLEVPWLEPTTLPSVLRTANVLAPDGYERPLTYPRSERRSELPAANILATDELADAGSILAGLLTLNDTVDEAYAKVAMLTSSVWVRPHPHRAVVRAREASQRVHARLEQVRVEGPSFVTMSSERGSFAVTLVNDLDEPVTVGIRTDTGTDDLRISEPEPVELGPNQRASVRLTATSQDIGVHSVRLTPVTAEGRPLGNTTKFSVRSSQVGFVIWVIMGVGGAVLVVAIALRIVKRVRRRKATHGPLLEDTAR